MRQPAASCARLRAMTRAPVVRSQSESEFVPDVRPRVLVVDDNVDLAWAIAMHLERLGYAARIANDGVVALAIAREFVPDLMLVDIALPGMNGWRLAREVKKLPLRKPPRMFAMSALDHEVHRERSRLVGFEAHLCKPFHIEQLLALAR